MTGATPPDEHHGKSNHTAPTALQDYMLRVLAVFAPDNGPAICWRLDGKYAPITFFADVSDVFWWGAPDTETIRMIDVPLLELAAADLRRRAGDAMWAAELYVARKRCMRPQGALYPKIPDVVRPLFDAVGPLRQLELTNPHRHPDDTPALPPVIQEGC